MKVNVYDFDKTIFAGDSTQKFYFYLLKKHPQIIIYLPKQLFYFILFSLKIIDKTSFKEKFYSCFKIIKNIDKEVIDFWKVNKALIKDFYYKNKKDTDIIISASPQFLLEPICEDLGIKYLIASKVDKKTGKYEGQNCYGKEKVIRLKKEMPEALINEFYSDSFSDEPLASIAQKAFLVKGDCFFEWLEYKKSLKNKGK